MTYNKTLQLQFIPGTFENMTFPSALPTLLEEAFGLQLLHDISSLVAVDLAEKAFAVPVELQCAPKGTGNHIPVR